MPSPAQKYARTPAAGNPARTEAWALLELARVMEGAKSAGTAQLLDALRRNWRLWTIFQASLIDAECKLPAPVRGNLLGLANFVDRHTAQLLSRPDAIGVDVLVNINRQIGEGLLEGQRAVGAKAPPSNKPATDAQLRESA